VAARRRQKVAVMSIDQYYDRKLTRSLYAVEYLERVTGGSRADPSVKRALDDVQEAIDIAHTLLEECRQR
jgi:hypothetical protein